MTKMTGLDLWGDSSFGPVHVTLNPGVMTNGWIEEKSQQYTWRVGHSTVHRYGRG